MRIFISWLILFILSTSVFGQLKGSREAYRIERDLRRDADEAEQSWRESIKLGVTPTPEYTARRPMEDRDVLRYIEQATEGMTGYLEKRGFVIAQIIDNNNMLLQSGEYVIWFIYPTANLADNDNVRVIGLTQCSGTKTYHTSQGTNTVRIIKLIPVDKIKETEAKQQAKQQVEEQQRKQAEWEQRWNSNQYTWIDKSGQYKIEAVYDFWLGEGKIRLLTKERKEITIKLMDLSETSKKHAIDLHKLEEEIQRKIQQKKALKRP